MTGICNEANPEISKTKTLINIPFRVIYQGLQILFSKRTDLYFNFVVSQQIYSRFLLMF
jgi:hypothetical protein